MGTIPNTTAAQQHHKLLLKIHPLPPNTTATKQRRTTLLKYIHYPITTENLVRGRIPIIAVSLLRHRSTTEGLGYDTDRERERERGGDANN